MKQLQSLLSLAWIAVIIPTTCERHALIAHARTANVRSRFGSHCAQATEATIKSSLPISTTFRSSVVRHRNHFPCGPAMEETSRTCPSAVIRV
jgi:hypothetical protein